jgi:succinate-semialdehyde dehydrogenase/glutarate-semialdehyde dehydrogenase
MVGEALQQIFDKAGLDNGEMQTLYSSPEQLDRIMANPLVGGVGFTGSTKAGSAIATCAAKHLKKSVMELGGSDPFIVLEDADIELAAKDAVRGRCANSGQVCFSPKRFIIVGRAYEVFKQKLIENLKKVVIGDPMDEKTQMGPLAKDSMLILGWKHSSRGYRRAGKSCIKLIARSHSSLITVYEADPEKPFHE